MYNSLKLTHSASHDYNFGGENKKSPPKPFGIIRKYLFIPITILVCWILFFRILLIGYVPSGSMLPNYKMGDLVVGVKIYQQGVRDLKHQEVIIFKDDDERRYIKRIIGLPDDTIKIKNGKVYRNGKVLNEKYLKEKNSTEGDGFYKVPRNHLFLMGDNRKHSIDSRKWNVHYINYDYILAKACFIIPTSRLFSDKKGFW